VRDYLASLDRVEGLAPRRLFPAHGPVIEDPRAAVAEFREHRIARVGAVDRALADLGAAGASVTGAEADALVEKIVRAVYGEGIEGRPLVGARWSVRAILEYLGVAPFPAEGAPSEGGGRLAPES
jgi:glyoxylase-like metal-dependent hydrolase (beta-lactamase superfamily II)